MVITIKAKDFSTVIRRALSVVETKSIFPALGHIKIVAELGSITVSSSNLGASIIQKAECTVSKPGTVLLPAILLSGVLAELPSDVEVTVEGDGVKPSVVRFSGGKCKFPALELESFPAIEAMPLPQFSLNTKTLVALVERVEFASVNKFKYGVMSILLQSAETSLRAVATDGLRIAVADAAGGPAEDFQIQLPNTFLPLFKELPGESVDVAESETSVFFQSAGVQVVSRKPVTKFPNYKSILEKTYSTEIKIAVPTLQRLLAVCMTVADSTGEALTKVINVAVKDGNLSISSESLNGEASVAEPVEQTGEENSVRVNPAFIQEFLDVVSEGKVSWQFSTPKTLMKLTNDAQDHHYFVMPKQ